MKITIEIECDNSAFDDPSEAARIIEGIAKKADAIEIAALDGLTLFDHNGNRVGSVTVDK